MLRHTPGATMNSSGSAGMTPFHMTYRPVSGHRDQQAGDDERAEPDDGADRAPGREAQARRDLRVVGERDRGHQPVHPAIWSLGVAEAGGEDRADVGQDGAAEVGAARGEREERLVAEAQDLGVAGRGDRHRARAAVEEGDLAERADRRDRAAGGVQAAVDEQVERAVALALRQDVLAGAVAAASRCARAAAPSPPRRGPRGTRAGCRSAARSVPGYWKKPVVSITVGSG